MSDVDTINPAVFMIAFKYETIERIISLISLTQKLIAKSNRKLLLINEHCFIRDTFSFHSFISLSIPSYLFPFLTNIKIAPIQFNVHPGSIKPIIVLTQRIMDYTVAVLVIVISQIANVFAAYIYANLTDRFLQCGSQVIITFDKNQVVGKNDPEESVRFSLRKGDSISMPLFENISNPIADIPIGLEIQFRNAILVDASPITKKYGKPQKEYPGFTPHVFKDFKWFEVKFTIHEEEYTVSINGVDSSVRIPSNKSDHGMGIIHISGFPISVIKNIKITHLEVYRCSSSYTLPPFLEPTTISRKKMRQKQTTIREM